MCLVSLRPLPSLAPQASMIETSDGARGVQPKSVFVSVFANVFVKGFRQGARTGSRKGVVVQRLQVYKIYINI